MAVTQLPDGRSLQLRTLDGVGEAVQQSLSESTREEYANLAFDLLLPPPTLEGWACRMVLGEGRKPARVEFLEYDASWERASVADLGVGGREAAGKPVRVADQRTRRPGRRRSGRPVRR
ncbi:MAG: hypothetical protein QOE76_2490 [Frankiales bacterium]|nr:hypothetical protein [Frankiales bacterium]